MVWTQTLGNGEAPRVYTWSSCWRGVGESPSRSCVQGDEGPACTWEERTFLPGGQYREIWQDSMTNGGGGEEKSKVWDPELKRNMMLLVEKGEPRRAPGLRLQDPLCRGAGWKLLEASSQALLCPVSTTPQVWAGSGPC